MRLSRQAGGARLAQSGLDVDLQCQDGVTLEAVCRMQLRESPAEERRRQAGAEKCCFHSRRTSPTGRVDVVVVIS